MPLKQLSRNLLGHANRRLVLLKLINRKGAGWLPFVYIASLILNQMLGESDNGTVVVL
jgi:hypothetical protein